MPWLENVRNVAKLLSYIAVIVAAPIALLEYHSHSIETENNSKKVRLEVAEVTYREAGDKYREFLKLCVERPRLDCYSVSIGDPDPPLSKEEGMQQKILYTYLTDVFEVAFVSYETDGRALDPEIQAIYKNQWPGWDVYIKKFLKRPAYCRVYEEIKDEYDNRLRSYMDSIAHETCRNDSAHNGG